MKLLPERTGVISFSMVENRTLMMLIFMIYTDLISDHQSDLRSIKEKCRVRKKDQYPSVFSIDLKVCSLAKSFVVISPFSSRSIKTCLGEGIRQC